MLRNPTQIDCAFLWPARVLLAILVLMSITACTTRYQNDLFDPMRCMEQVPRDVKGLTVVAGPRTKSSIIRDMVPVICNGQVLFRRIKEKDPSLKAGSVVFRVMVEYTGEVISVNVEETTINSDLFVRKVSDFIMDTDFISWARSDIDALFIYPAQFGK